MHQLILVHSHLLDQSDREGVSCLFSLITTSNILMCLFWTTFYPSLDTKTNRILHFTWRRQIIRLTLPPSFSRSTVKVSLMSNVTASTNHQQKKHAMLHIFSFSYTFILPHTRRYNWSNEMVKKSKKKPPRNDTDGLRSASQTYRFALFFFFFFSFFFLFFLFLSLPVSCFCAFLFFLIFLSNTCSLNFHPFSLKCISLRLAKEVTLAMVLHPTRFVTHPSEKHYTNILKWCICFARGDELIGMGLKRFLSLTEGLIVNMPEVMTVSWHSQLIAASYFLSRVCVCICLSFALIGLSQSVLDKGITQSSNTSEDSKSFFIKYDFGILELKSEEALGKGPLPYLNLMLQHHREQLLSHPLCIKYLETKWSVREMVTFILLWTPLTRSIFYFHDRNTYGMYFHLTILAFYTVFLGSLTYYSVCLPSQPSNSSVSQAAPIASTVSQYTSIDSSANESTLIDGTLFTPDHRDHSCSYSVS